MSGDVGRGLGQNGAMLHERFRPENPGTGRLLLAVTAACLCTVAVSADQAGFSGKVVVELLDGIEFAYKLRLLDDFAFTDAGGKVWLARKGGILDGESVPRELYSLGGLPYPSEYRRAAVVHDYFCGVRTEPWRQVHRTFYHASIVEGVSEAQAKALYAVVYAGGWRWEQKGSSCYRSCHAAAASLAWKPAAIPAEVQPVLQWIAQDGPTLDEIDVRMDAVIRKPGPHLFAQRY
ncbi:MAG: DUF1353 domain-containing protein [Betaproteobacteria bacterium]|nr:DUF1353 domain-containing protein [Betaproteobacteria bacterium]